MVTKLSNIRRTSFMVVSPRKYARDSLATIGIQSRTFGTLSHAIQVSDVKLHNAK